MARQLSHDVENRAIAVHGRRSASAALMALGTERGEAITCCGWKHSPVFNLAFLVLDIYIAHAENTFRHWAE